MGGAGVDALMPVGLVWGFGSGLIFGSPTGVNT